MQSLIIAVLFEYHPHMGGVMTEISVTCKQQTTLWARVKKLKFQLI